MIISALPQERLLQEFIRATLRYSTSQLQCFKDDADACAARLINSHGVEPAVLSDLYLGLTAE